MKAGRGKIVLAGGLARGETLTEAKAVYPIDNGLATGRLNVMTQGTRKGIIAEIMEWSATWGSPLSREQAEANPQSISILSKSVVPVA